MSLTTPNRITVHYHRPGDDLDGWQLWAWDRATEALGAALDPIGADDFGVVFELEPRRHGGGPAIGLLPRRGAWESRDLPERVWRAADGNEIWLLEGDRRVHRSRPATTPYVIDARMKSWSTLDVRLSEPVADPHFEWPGCDRAPAMAGAVCLDAPGGAGRVWRLALARPLHPEADAFWTLRLGARGYRPVGLDVAALLDGPEFQPCGAFGVDASPEATRFRVFAPTASRVTVRLYNTPHGGEPEEIPLERQPQGAWEGSDPRDLAGYWYTFSVDGTDSRFDPTREVVDPWARGTSGHDGRGLILRDATPVADPPRFPRRDAVIYELHLRDFTIDPASGVTRGGSYLGAVEPGTRLTTDRGIATGIDHLVELGVNTVQILPLMDFENDERSPAYNWGYMPVHFNAPDGWYASSPDGPERVVELKRMVDGFHRRGLKVVLDVVFNHTAEKAPEKVFSFEGIVPGYYYRHWGDGTLANGSACGNEFRTEAPMARRFVVETLRYWATAYRIDGFRFDLMGLIDLDTMRAVVRELRSLDPEFLIYGEPWAAAASPIELTSKGRQRGEGFAVFNDGFRDAVKGGVFDAQPGFIQGGDRRDDVVRGLAGGIDDFASDPLESVNFVECHDNATLYDRLLRTTAGAVDVDDAARTSMHHLAGALVLLAPGLPFLHAGQEMLRTKQGDENSYRSPDAINAIRWDWKKTHAGSVAWHAGLIALRQAHPLFRPETAGAVRSRYRWLHERPGGLPAGLVGVVIDGDVPGETWRCACLLFNGGSGPETVTLPPGAWCVHAEKDTASLRPLRGGATVTGTFAVPARGVVVLAQPVA